MRLRGIVFAIGATLVLASVATYAVGTQLPATRTGTASLSVERPAHEVMAVLTDVASQPRWRPDVAAVDVQSPTAWIERKADGEVVTFRITAHSERSLHLAFESSRGYVGQWHGSLTPAAQTGSTLIEVQESATIDAPLQRVIARVVFDPEEFAADYLARLAGEVRRRAR